MLPFETLTLICTILRARGDTHSLTKLMRVSARMYDIASPVLYHRVRVTERDMKSFLLGLRPRERKPVKLVANQRVAYRMRAYHPNTARQTRKISLLGHIVHLELILGPVEWRWSYHQSKRYRLILQWTLEGATSSSAIRLGALQTIKLCDSSRFENLSDSDAVLSTISMHRVTRRPEVDSVSTSDQHPYAIHVRPGEDQVVSGDSKVVSAWLSNLSARGDLASLTFTGTVPAALFEKASLWRTDQPIRIDMDPRTNESSIWVGEYKKEWRLQQTSHSLELFKVLLKQKSDAENASIRIELIHTFTFDLDETGAEALQLRNAVLESLRQSHGIVQTAELGANGEVKTVLTASNGSKVYIVEEEEGREAAQSA